MDLTQFLISIGVNLSSSVIYDSLKERFASSKSCISQDDVLDSIASLIELDNSKVIAEKIVKFLADNGDIEIRNSFIYSKEGIFYSTNKTGNLIIGSNTKSETEKTNISVGQNAKINLSGGANIVQDKDGNIIFST
jgi:hypothetical protein